MDIHELNVAELTAIAEAHTGLSDEREVRRMASAGLVREWIAAPAAFAEFVREQAGEAGIPEDGFVREASARSSRADAPAGRDRRESGASAVPGMPPTGEAVLFGADDIKPGEHLIVRSVRPADPLSGEPDGYTIADVVRDGDVYPAVWASREDPPPARD